MRWKWSSCKQRWVQVGPRSMHRMHTHSRSASSQYFTHNNNNTVTCVIMETVGHKSPSRPSIRTAFKYIFKFSLSGSWKCNDDEAMSGESPPDVLLTVYFTGRAVVNLRKPSVMSLQHWAALPQSAWEILLGKHLFLRWTKKKKTASTMVFHSTGENSKHMWVQAEGRKLTFFTAALSVPVRNHHVFRIHHQSFLL